MADNIVSLIAGTRGTGKTDFLKNMIVSPSPLQKKLIIDTFDNSRWRTMETWDQPQRHLIEVPILWPDQFEIWQKGLYRMFSSDPDELFNIIQEHAINTLLVFEDATKIIDSKTLQKPIKKFVLDSKQKNLNIVFCFHSLMDIPAGLVRIADTLTLFKTGESKPPSKFEFVVQLPAIMEHVKNSESRYQNVTIRLN